MTSVFGASEASTAAPNGPDADPIAPLPHQVIGPAMPHVTQSPNTQLAIQPVVQPLHENVMTHEIGADDSFISRAETPTHAARHGSDHHASEDRSAAAAAAALETLSSPREHSQTPPSNGGVATKRAHKRTFQTMTNGPKIPHLKKREGEALWRHDIQFDFLNAVFTDSTKAFTNEYRAETHDTFAKVYLDAMANSTKCSKVLSEKLTGESAAGLKIAMVCLLVNLGRMNTTLNFFPEMRAVLRTYHPIPSLQTKGTQDYKQLQDAPRLKSILKGACEGADEPSTLEALERAQKLPRSNPINLIFLMSTFPQLVERQFIPESSHFSFYDIIMDTTKTSASRARAFLWLIWAYLESPSLGDQSGNPFGVAFPMPETLKPEVTGKENIDTSTEIMFGNQMTLQRLAILDSPVGGDASAPPAVSSSMVTDIAAADAPLAIPKPKLRSAKDRRLHDEVNKLLREKRLQRRSKRHARNNAVRDLWQRIESLDPLYDTDDDLEKAKIRGKSHGLGSGVLAAGISTKYSDYGENSISLAKGMEAAAKKIAMLD